MTIEDVNLIICVAALLVCVACWIGVTVNARKVRRANEQIAAIQAGGSTP